MKGKNSISIIKAYWKCYNFLCLFFKKFFKITRNKHRFYVVFISFLYATILTTNAQEIRLGMEYTKDIIPKLELTGNLELRNSFNYKNYYYPVLQIGTSYDIFKNISLGGSVRYSLIPEQEKSNNEFSFEDLDEKIRYTAELKIKSERFKNDIKFNNRIRYQYSTKNGERTHTYLRYKIGIDYKINKKTEPYVSLEPYLNIEDCTIQNIRLNIGNEFEAFNRDFDIYLMVEGKIKKQILSTFHAIGFTFKF